MTAKLLQLEVITALRAGAMSPQGWPLEPGTPKRSARCRCCGGTIRHGESADSVHLSFNDNYAYGSICWMHEACDPAKAGDEPRFPVAEQGFITRQRRD